MAMNGTNLFCTAIRCCRARFVYYLLATLNSPLYGYRKELMLNFYITSDVTDESGFFFCEE
jgi:hypothetical protein